jgi:hypothetical protein
MTHKNEVLKNPPHSSFTPLAAIFPLKYDRRIACAPSQRLRFRACRVSALLASRGNVGRDECIDFDAVRRSIDQYREMYAQSINDPDKFWGEIADTFYWKKRWNLLTRSNFDCKKGPISIGIQFIYFWRCSGAPYCRRVTST